MSEQVQPLKIKPVNVRQVFHDKNQRLSVIIPGFIYKYLERIVHQKDINDFLAVHGDKYGLDFACAAIRDFNVTVTVKGEENLPLSDRCIFASNHPLGGFDGLLLMDVISRYYQDFRFLSNDIIMNVVNIQPLLLPINKHGKQDLKAAQELHKAFLSDMQIVTFPSGLVSRRIRGQIMDLEWKKNFITKAIQYKRNIIPVHFTGRNSNFFYNLHSLRKFLGIKANLEMLYLVDETYKHRNDHLTVTFGKPIPYATFDRSKTPIQWAKWVKEQVYGMVGITDVPL